jgi:hypothetical protein
VRRRRTVRRRQREQDGEGRTVKTRGQGGVKMGRVWAHVSMHMFAHVCTREHAYDSYVSMYM